MNKTSAFVLKLIEQARADIESGAVVISWSKYEDRDAAGYPPGAVIIALKLTWAMSPNDTRRARPGVRRVSSKGRK